MNQPRIEGPHDPDSDARRLLGTLFRAAVDAADPLEGMRRHLPAPPKGRTVVVGAGKGAAQMARALDSLWDAPYPGWW